MPGSSSGQDEPHQIFYNRVNFQTAAENVPSIDAARNEIVRDIRAAKKGDRNVVMIELRPVLDSGWVLEPVKDVLDANDRVLVAS